MGCCGCKAAPAPLPLASDAILADLPPRFVRVTSESPVERQAEFADVVARAFVGSKGKSPEGTVDWWMGPDIRGRGGAAPWSGPLTEDPPNSAVKAYAWYVRLLILYASSVGGLCLALTDSDARDAPFVSAMVLMPPNKVELHDGNKHGTICLLCSMLRRIGTPSFSKASRARGKQVETTMEALHKESMPPSLFWYLADFATRPSAQGQGHGKTMLQLLLQLADTDKVPVFLETVGAANEAMYGRFGFRTRKRYIVPPAPGRTDHGYYDGPLDVNGGLAAMLRLPGETRRFTNDGSDEGDAGAAAASGLPSTQLSMARGASIPAGASLLPAPPRAAGDAGDSTL